MKLLVKFFAVFGLLIPSLLFGQISASVQEGCAPLSVTFSINNLQGNLNWTFGNGSTSSFVNPTVLFTSPGSYSIAVSNGIQTFNLTGGITVNTRPQPQITLATDTFCIGDTVNLQVNASASSAVGWDFGDGGFAQGNSVSHVYTQSGSMNITVMETNSSGCVGYESTEQPIVIQDAPNTQFILSEDLFCSTPAMLTATPLNAALENYQWLINNVEVDTSTVYTGTLTSIGNYNIGLKSVNISGCVSTHMETFSLVLAVTPNFDELLIPNCAPLILAENAVAGFTEEWWFWNEISTPQQAPTVISQFGVDTITFIGTDTSGCVVVDSNVFINVLNSPTAQFQISDTFFCESGTATLTNIGIADSSRWVVGADTLYGNTVTVNLSLPGWYNVKLHSIMSNGCIDSATIFNAILVESAGPINELVHQTFCAPAEFDLRHQNPSLVSAIWIIPGIDTAIGDEVSFNINQVGNYDLWFVGESISGCTDTIVHQNILHVIEQDVAFNSPSIIDLCGSETLVFDAGIFRATPNTWSLNGIAVSTDSLWTNTFTNSGNYIVGFEGISVSGCLIHIDTHTVVRVSSLQNQITIDSVNCANQSVQLSFNNESIESWTWNIGNDTFNTNPLVFNAQQDSSLTIQLAVEDTLGCTMSIIASNQDFISGCEGQSSFSGQSQNASGLNPAGWGLDSNNPLGACAPATIILRSPLDTNWTSKWYFGYGDSVAGNSVAWLFDSAGLYNIHVVNTNTSTLQSDTAVFVNVVKIGKPNSGFDFEQSSQCNGSLLKLIDFTNSATSWYTTFDNGSVSIAKEPTQIYDSAGYYTITRRASDSNGCASTTHRLVAVGPPFIELDIPELICGEDTVKFNHNITGYLEYKWNIGSQEFFGAYPNVHLQDTGTFIITLTVTDSSGCELILIDGLDISRFDPIASFSMPSAFNGCQSLNEVVSNNSIGSTEHKWYLNGQFLSNSRNLNASVIDTGEQIITLVASNQGCRNEFSDTFSIHYPLVDFNIGVSDYCVPSVLTFTDNSQSAVQWQWNFGNGQTSTQQNPQITFLQSQSDSVSLIIKDQWGCLAEVSKPIPTLLDIDIQIQSNSICLPATFILGDSGSCANTWYWNVNGIASSGSTVSFMATDTGDFDVVLTVSHTSGCTITATIDSLFEFQVPKSIFSIENFVNQCAPSMLSFHDESENAVAWKWLFGDGITSSDRHPVHFFSEPGSYQVILVIYNSQGCADTSVQTFALLGPVAMFELTPKSVCESNLVNFKNSSINNVFNNWYFGDGSSVSSVDAQHIFDHAGQFDIALVVTDSNGCNAMEIYPNFTVNLMPKPMVELKPEGNCIPVSVKWEDYSVDLEQPNFTWTDLSGGELSWSDTTIIIKQPGIHRLNLKITNANGCSAEIRMNDSIVAFDTVSNTTIQLNDLSVSEKGVSVGYSLTTSQNYLDAQLFVGEESGWREVVRASDRNLEYLEAGQNGEKEPVCFKLLDNHKCVIKTIDEVKQHCSINVKASQNEGANYVQWTTFPNCNFEGYKLYSQSGKESDRSELLGQFTDYNRSFLDTMDYCPGDVFYYVEAVNISGSSQVSKSNIPSLSVDTLPFLVEPIDIHLVSVNDDQSMLIQWKRDDVKSPLIAGYKLFRTSTDTTSATIAIDPLQTVYIDSEVNSGNHIYEYSLVRQNTCLISTINGLDANSILLKVDQSGQDVRFNWNTYNAWEGEIQYYELEVKDNFGNWNSVKQLSEAEREAVINLLELD